MSPTVDPSADFVEPAGLAAASPADMSRAFRAAAEGILPAVVQITGRGEPEPLLGSGVIVESSGVVLTNHHVVDASDPVAVRTADGRRYDIVRVTSDPYSDVAVVELELDEPLPAARMGDSRLLGIGDWVLTIGSPLDLGPSVSAGIISATQRIPEGAAQVPLLQTDAAINPGTSGGALVNLRGEFVGIATAIASRDGGFQGIGFAIPSDTAEWVSGQLRTHGRVPRADIGVRTTSHRAPSPSGGAVVVSVDPHAPGHAAGLRERDVIVAVDGQSVANGIEFQQLLERRVVGTACTLELIRDGAAITCQVVPQELAARPDGEPLRPEPEAMGPLHGALVYSVELQASASPLAPEQAQQLGLPDGLGVRVVRVDPQGPAYRAGLRETMVILQVGNQPLEDLDDFADAMEDESIERGIVLGVHDPAGLREIRVTLQ